MGKGPKKEAEGGGFEPPVPIRVRQFSKLVVSATHPSFQMGLNDYEYPLVIGVQMYIKFCFLQIFYAQNLHFTQFSTSNNHFAPLPQNPHEETAPVCPPRYGLFLSHKNTVFVINHE